jgi:hypothetical protein
VWYSHPLIFIFLCFTEKPSNYLSILSFIHFITRLIVSTLYIKAWLLFFIMILMLSDSVVRGKIIIEIVAVKNNIDWKGDALFRFKFSTFTLLKCNLCVIFLFSLFSINVKKMVKISQSQQISKLRCLYLNTPLLSSSSKLLSSSRSFDS